MELYFESHPIQFVFLLSFFVLIVVSILKYALNKRMSLLDVYHVSLEIPIDTCTILIAVIVSVYRAISKDFPFLLIFITLFVVVIATIFRRQAQHRMEESKIIQSLIWGFLDAALVIIWAIMFKQLM